MPPFQKNKSKAQQRLMFAKANRGEVSMEDAVGRARASKGAHLPERKRKKGRKRGRHKGRR
jgi:hypothetical protein